MMPWVLDAETGRDQFEIAGRWHPEHDLSRAFVDFHRLPEGVEAPVHVLLTSAPERLPEYTALLNRQIFAGLKARDLLEKFLANEVQFTDAIVTMPDGSVYGESVFLVTFGDGVYVDDGIVVEESDVTPSSITHVQAPDGRSIPLPPRLDVTKYPPRLMWHRSAVGDRHIWIDKRLRNRVVASDDLYQAMKDAGITGFQAQESLFKRTH